MSYGVWIQMVDLDSIEIKKATKKTRSSEGQSPFDKMQKKERSHQYFLEGRVDKKKDTIEQHLDPKEDPRQQGLRGHSWNTYCNSNRW
jgi:hypothetical protein